MKAEKIWRAAGFAVALTVYFFFALSDLRSPGLYYDEVLFANAALGNQDGLFVAWGIPWGGHRFPLMLMGYIGALKAYVYAPLFALFGTSVPVIRWPMILCGAITLWLSWLLSTRMFGQKVGWTLLFLTATDPSFIMNHRMDWGPVALGLLFKASSLYLIWRWLEEGKRRLLLAAAFLMGLGLYDKAIFLWYLLALAVALRLLFGRRLKELCNRRLIAGAFGLFLLGALPFVAYNFRGPLRSFRQPGVLNPAPLSDWKTRLKLVQMTLDGSAAFYNIHHYELGRYWDQAPATADTVLEAWREWVRPLRLEGSLLSRYLLGAFLVLAILLLAKRVENPKPVLFLLLLLFCMYGASWLSMNRATGQHHVVPLYPLPHLVVALALWGLGRIYPAVPEESRALLQRALPLGLMAILLLSQVNIDVAYVDSFQKQGGAGLWSESIVDLAEFARSHREQDFYLLDWGISNQLLLLGKSEIRKAEYYQSIREARNLEEQRKAWRLCLRRPGTWLIFHDPACETYPALRIFERVLAAEGGTRRLIRELDDRQGRPVFWIYEVELPELSRYRAAGGLWVWHEAEDWQGISRGGWDFPQGASLGRALGMRWGRRLGDWAQYDFALARPLHEARFLLRYVQQGCAGRRLRVEWDGQHEGDLWLEPCAGNGNRTEDWQMAALKMGILPLGKHRLQIINQTAGNGISLDCWVISEGEAPALW
jgi:4-amino-4-deoxy-L-arabinose transferase-like glycosyltransferase